MTVVKTKYRGSIEYQLIMAELVTAARYRGTVTYQEIAKIIGLPLAGNYMGTAIGQLVGEISEEEHMAGRPMLSAIVVNTTGKPGPGFFSLARQLGKLQDESRKGEMRFWEKEMRAVYKTWKTVLK